MRAFLADPRYTVVVKATSRASSAAHHGGIYVDTDMECLRPFDEFERRFFAAGESDDGLPIGGQRAWSPSGGPDVRGARAHPRVVLSERMRARTRWYPALFPHGVLRERTDCDCTR